LKRRIFIGAAAAFIVLPASVRAATVNAPGGVAIEGHDPVAYRTQSKAVKGDASITAEHAGATYHFASKANRDAFLADPVKYAPQYGGFCAYAVANGYTAKIDPQVFTVVDDKLYLNFSKAVRSRWETDIPGHIASGDANWPALSRQ
jgi:YHS domain-containing protein